MTKETRIEDLLQWSNPERMDTIRGPKDICAGFPNENFWQIWKKNKEILKQAGIKVNKDKNGKWFVMWEKDLSAEEFSKIDSSRATNAEIYIPAPKDFEYLDYQKAGIKFCYDKFKDRKAVLLADQMGLGKTIQAIGLINLDPTIKNVLVICPASLRLNWKREMDKWLTRDMEVVVVNGGKQEDWICSEITIINYDVVEKHRKRIDFNGPYDLVILDESQMLRNPVKRTKAVYGHTTEKGKLKEKPIDTRRMLALTGTPIVNRPKELWTFLQYGDPAVLGKSFSKYHYRYCAPESNGYGTNFNGASNLEELQRSLRSRLMCRRLKEDVLKELPDKRRQVIEIPANGAGAVVAAEREIWEKSQQEIADLEKQLKNAQIARQYNDDLATQMYDDQTIADLKKQLQHAKITSFGQLAKARKLTAMAKVPHVIEHIKQGLEEGPIICFAHHKDVVHAINQHFEYKASVITGDVSMKQRQIAVDQFQNGDVDLFIGNIQAAGVGITLTRSSHVIFAELDWTPAAMTQAEDRAHRIGQKDNVLVQHIVLEGSVDAMVVNKLIEKQKIIYTAMDELPETSIFDLNPIETVTIEMPKVPKNPQSLTPLQIRAVHEGLQMLNYMCDGALAIDGQGFNKWDSEFGKSLATLPTLTMNQAIVGHKLVRKYRKQLPASILKEAGIKIKKKA